MVAPRSPLCGHQTNDDLLLELQLMCAVEASAVPASTRYAGMDRPAGMPDLVAWVDEMAALALPDRVHCWDVY